MRTCFFFLGFFISCINLSVGQNENPELKNVIPPSPTVASLGKYGEIPVGLYTGTPNISIPLYEIKDGSLSIPISLSYHAAGIRVEEIASDVGLGWSLNAGGVLGRQIRGKADEFGWIKSSQDRISSIIQSGNNNDINDMAQSLNLGSIDGEADLYYYNFNGRSGKFLFDEGGTLYNYPAENVSIQPLDGTIFFGSGWEVVVEDGTIYQFNKPELVYTSTCIGCEGSEQYTSWYLTKIISADGKGQVDFTYDYISYNIETPVGETRNFSLNPGNCLPPYVNTIANSYYQTWQLSRIDFSGGYVEFLYDEENDRQDYIANTSHPHALKKVIVNDSTSIGSHQIKEFELGYGYFGAANATAYEKRLKLISLTEKTTIGSKPPYIFTYEETIQMPSRFSTNKDHWGYFNGANNTTTIPESNTVYNYGPYADRSANESTMQACILKKITYPTGGETLFTYETNQSTDPRVEVAEYNETLYVLNDDQLWSSLISPYETTDTFIVPVGNEVEVSIFIEGLAESGSVNNCDAFYWYLLKDGLPTSYSGNINQIWDNTTVDLVLEPGTYKFKFNFDCYNPQGRLDYNIVATVFTPVENNGTVLRHVGGLRIKQMEDNPSDGGPAVIKDYKYPVSGSLVNFPDYNAHELTVNMTGIEGSGGGCSILETCNYWVATSTTNYPLAMTNGSYVGYSKVIEDLGENGEIEHHYSTFTTGNGQFPFPPLETSEWAMGRETQTLYYLVDGNGDRIPDPVKEVSYDYVGLTTETIASYRSSSQSIYIGPCNTGPYNPFITYYVVPQFFYLSGIRERTYDQNNPSKWIETTTRYTHDSNHYQQKEVVTSVSGNDGTIKDQLVMKRKFPQDYNTANASGSEALGIKKLNELHIVNVPLEEYVLRRKIDTITNQISDERVVSAVITTFKQNDPYPDKILRLEKNNAMSLANFGTGSTITNNVFVKNSNPTISNSFTSAIEFNTYDSDGNVTTQRKADGTYVSYIWGYNGQYPIAKLENLQYSSISTGTITDLKNKSNLDNDTCLDSGSCNEKNLRTALNALSTTFPSTMVTTYTYDPLIGVTSMTDAKGYTVYYEYDEFNRLKYVKDADGKLLSKNSYHYRNQ